MKYLMGLVIIMLLCFTMYFMFEVETSQNEFKQCVEQLIQQQNNNVCLQTDIHRYEKEIRNIANKLKRVADKAEYWRAQHTLISERSVVVAQSTDTIISVANSEVNAIIAKQQANKFDFIFTGNYCFDDTVRIGFGIRAYKNFYVGTISGTAQPGFFFGYTFSIKD